MPKVTGHFIKEVMQVHNKDTGSVTYWVLKCGVWSRIGLEEYRKDWNGANQVSSMVTKATGNKIRHYTTLHYIYR